ncbi:hypothetical protein [Kocuria carniphila]|uniref:hypothetical protein n=1 Tax=Kocuria carniphila TaxID=262208 RepID=UPI002882EB18|nr:hypothetical protein [Kocuria carniphila]
MRHTTPGDGAATTAPGSPNLHFDPHNPSGKHFLGQPRMLANLFSVELWERFSFYGMQALVLYYMYYQTTDGGLGIDEGEQPGSWAPMAAPCTCAPSWAVGSPTV